MSKKILSLVLALALLASCFAGCGKQESSKPESSQPESSSSASEPQSSDTAKDKTDEEPYTVHFAYYIAKESPNMGALSDAVNELTMNELNMKVDLQALTSGTYHQQIPMMLAAGEPMDVFISRASEVGTFIESQYILDCTPYLDKMENAKAALGDDIQACYIGDFLAGFGSMAERATPGAMVVRKDIFDELGFKKEDFDYTLPDMGVWDQITEMYAKVKEKYPNIICFDGTAVPASCAFCFVDNLSSSFGVLETPDSTTVVNWFETDMYRRLCEIAADWYTKGYSSKDIAVNTDGGDVKMKGGNCFSYFQSWKPGVEIEKKSQTGYEVEMIQLVEAPKTSYNVNTRLWSIANSSENPEKAAEFLDWTYKSGEFTDLINWGVPGTDWVLNEEGQADYPEGITAATVGYHNDKGFSYPNQFNGTLWAGAPKDQWEQYETWHSTLKESAAFGFAFNSMPVATEMATLQTVYDKYNKTVGFGTMPDLDAAIKEFNDALYEAGLQKVLDEKQAQLDAWSEKK